MPLGRSVLRLNSSDWRAELRELDFREGAGEPPSEHDRRRRRVLRYMLARYPDHRAEIAPTYRIARPAERVARPGPPPRALSHHVGLLSGDHACSGARTLEERLATFIVPMATAYALIALILALVSR